MPNLERTAGFVLNRLHEPTTGDQGLFAQVPRTLMVSVRAGPT